MENESDKLTVAGNATSELTDGKINSAIDEIKVFIAEDIILRNYNFPLYCNAAHVGIMYVSTISAQ